MVQKYRLLYSLLFDYNTMIGQFLMLMKIDSNVGVISELTKCKMPATGRYHSYIEWIIVLFCLFRSISLSRQSSCISSIEPS